MKKWILIILGLLGLDQLTKYLVVANFAFEGDTLPIINGFFHITYVRNSGAVFGMSQGAAEQYFWVFLIVIVIATAIFVYMFSKIDFNDKRMFWYTLAISLLIAGALGNGVDRLIQPDHNVIDMIDFRGIWQYVFNVADICLNIGIGLFIIDTFFLEPKRKKPVTNE